MRGALPIVTAGVYVLRNAFKARARLLPHPQPGCVGFYGFGDGHAVLVESVTAGAVTDITGNTTGE
jgi:hypothetical protein